MKSIVVTRAIETNVRGTRRGGFWMGGWYWIIGVDVVPNPSMQWSKC